MSSCSLPTLVFLRDPLTAEEHIDLGYIYEKKGKIDLAEEEYIKAIKKDRRQWKAYYNLGNLYAKRGEYEKAVGLYEKALNINREGDVLNNLAYSLYKLGDYCGALEYIEEALKKGEREEYRETHMDIRKAIEEKGVDCLLFKREG
jgi:Flp pilus assembly protein TadD